MFTHVNFQRENTQKCPLHLQINCILASQLRCSHAAPKESLLLAGYLHLSDIQLALITIKNKKTHLPLTGFYVFLGNIFINCWEDKVK